MEQLEGQIKLILDFFVNIRDLDKNSMSNPSRVSSYRPPKQILKDLSLEGKRRELIISNSQEIHPKAPRNTPSRSSDFSFSPRFQTKLSIPGDLDLTQLKDTSTLRRQTVGTTTSIPKSVFYTSVLSDTNFGNLRGSIVLLRDLLGSNLLTFKHEEVIRIVLDKLEKCYLDQLRIQNTRNISLTLNELKDKVSYFSSSIQSLKESMKDFTMFGKQMTSFIENYRSYITQRKILETTWMSKLQRLSGLSSFSPISQCISVLEHKQSNSTSLKNIQYPSVYPPRLVRHSSQSQSISQARSDLSVRFQTRVSNEYNPKHYSFEKLSTRIDQLKNQVYELQNRAIKAHKSSKAETSRGSIVLSILRQVNSLFEINNENKKVEFPKLDETSINFLNTKEKKNAAEIWRSLIRKAEDFQENVEKVKDLETRLNEALIVNEKMMLETIVGTRKSKMAKVSLKNP